jgi:hypothetical protein
MIPKKRLYPLGQVCHPGTLKPEHRAGKSEEETEGQGEDSASTPACVLIQPNLLCEDGQT